MKNLLMCGLVLTMMTPLAARAGDELTPNNGTFRTDNTQAEVEKSFGNLVLELERNLERDSVSGLH